MYRITERKKQVLGSFVDGSDPSRYYPILYNIDMGQFFSYLEEQAIEFDDEQESWIEVLATLPVVRFQVVPYTKHGFIESFQVFIDFLDESKKIHSIQFWKLRRYLTKKILNNELLVLEDPEIQKYTQKLAEISYDWKSSSIICICAYMEISSTNNSFPEGGDLAIDPDFNFGSVNIEEWRLITKNPGADLTDLAHVLQFNPVENLDFDNVVVSQEKFSFSPGTYANFSVVYRNCRPRSYGSPFLELIGLDKMQRHIEYSSAAFEEDAESKSSQDIIKAAANMAYKFLYPGEAGDTIVACRSAWRGYLAHTFNDYFILVQRWNSFYFLNYMVDNATCAGFQFRLEIVERSSIARLFKGLGDAGKVLLLKNNYKDQWYPPDHPLATVLDKGEDSESDVSDFSD